MGNGLFQIRTSKWRENNRINPQGKEDTLPVFSVAHPQPNLPPKAFKENSLENMSARANKSHIQQHSMTKMIVHKINGGHPNNIHLRL